MPDILKMIMSENAADPEGYLLSLDDWSPALAEARAKQVGLSLSGKHWDVIYFLRKDYMRSGPAEHSRRIVEALEQRFRNEGGSKALYQLFPGGPVRQASYLAGLPVPADAVDRSFGTVR
jgi:tRNA 2-thiouridine synthesizing protein E